MRNSFVILLFDIICPGFAIILTIAPLINFKMIFDSKLCSKAKEAYLKYTSLKIAEETNKRIKIRFFPQSFLVVILEHSSNGTIKEENIKSQIQIKYQNLAGYKILISILLRIPLSFYFIFKSEKSETNRFKNFNIHFLLSFRNPYRFVIRLSTSPPFRFSSVNIVARSLASDIKRRGSRDRSNFCRNEPFKLYTTKSLSHLITAITRLASELTDALTFRLVPYTNFPRCVARVSLNARARVASNVAFNSYTRISLYAWPNVTN